MRLRKESNCNVTLKCSDTKQHTELVFEPMHDLFEGNALFETRGIESGFTFDCRRVRLRLIGKILG